MSNERASEAAKLLDDVLWFDEISDEVRRRLQKVRALLPKRGAGAYSRAYSDDGAG